MRNTIAATMLVATIANASAESTPSGSFQSNGAPFEVHSKVDNGASIVEFRTRIRSDPTPLEPFLYFKVFAFVGEEQSWLRFGEKSGLGFKVGSTLSFDITPHLRAQTSFEVWAVPSIESIERPAKRLGLSLTIHDLKVRELRNVFMTLDYFATHGNQLDPLQAQWSNTVKVKMGVRF